MRVLVIHNYYRLPGGEFSAVEAERALLERHGHEVITWSRHNDEIEEMGAGDRVELALGAIYSRASRDALRAEIDRCRPDIAHVHNVFPLLSPSIFDALHEGRVPIVKTAHNYRLLCPNGLFYTQGTPCERCRRGNTLHAIRHRCYRDSRAQSAVMAASIAFHRRRGTFARIDHLIAPSRFVAELFESTGILPPDRISVVGNFVPDPLPDPGGDRREPFLLYLGRLSPEKGVALLIEAMARNPHVTLRIAGEGEQRAALEQRVARLGLANVRFEGHVGGERKWSLLRRALATVVPSRTYETCPIAALESMATATPVIATDHGSLPTMIDHGVSGLLFTRHDPGALAQQIAAIVADPARAREMGRAARERIEHNYSAAAHYRGLMTVYARVVAGAT